MTPKASVRCLRQMLNAWGRCVSRHPDRSPISGPPLMHLVARCERRLDNGATAADVLLLEVAEFFQTDAEQGILRSETAEIGERAA